MIRSKHENVLRATVRDGYKVLGYGRKENRLRTSLIASAEAVWDNELGLLGNCDCMIYACDTLQWNYLKDNFDRPWEAEEPGIEQQLVEAIEEIKRLRQEIRQLTEQNIRVSTELLKVGPTPEDTCGYHYAKGYTEGKKAGKNEMEHKRGKMQSQRDYLAKVLGRIVQLTPAEVRKTYLRGSSDD